MKAAIVINILAACFNFLLAANNYAKGNHDLVAINLIGAFLSTIIVIFLVIYESKR